MSYTLFCIGVKKMNGKDIVLLKKHIRNKYVWYFYYNYTDDGLYYNRSNRFSTGIEVDFDNIEKSKRKAYSTARKIRFIKEKERLDTNCNDIFKNYTEKWFIWGECPYITAEQKRGRQLSRGNADTNRRILKSKLLPNFGKLKLKEITTSDIEKWMFKMDKEGLSGRSINIYYGVLQSILSEAKRLSDIQKNPCDNVKRMAQKKFIREILTMEEYIQLSSESNISNIWSDQIMYYTIYLIGASCGLRLGEIQALKVKNIDIDKLSIKVSHSWDRTYGIVPTKTKETRFVPITPKIAKYLTLCISVNPKGHVFSANGGESPLYHTTIIRAFYKSLNRIGIDEEKRKDRNLTFHSLRHFANTYFNNHLAQNQTMKIIGHSTVQMNQHYDHITDEGLMVFRKVMEKLEKEQIGEKTIT